jgi:cytochrome bd ubiquinol oxidase subunit II
MVTLHGGAYLAVKTGDPVAARARHAAAIAGSSLIALFALAGLWVAFGLDAYRIVGTIAHDAASNPMGKEVTREIGGWLANYGAMPWTILAPISGFAGALLAVLMLRRGHAVIGFLASTAAVIGVVATSGLSMFPFILPSSLDPKSSLTVWDASSSRTTLLIMLVVTAIVMPVVLAYTAFVFRVLRGKITTQQVETDHMSY